MVTLRRPEQSKPCSRAKVAEARRLKGESTIPLGSSDAGFGDRRQAPSEALPSLSALVPAFNEEPTIAEVLERVRALPLTGLEILVVDDGSTDGTAREARRIADLDPRIRVFSHSENSGKGAAVRTALRHARGDVVVVQDADLECDPRDLLTMLARFRDADVHVVYGVRPRWTGNPRGRWLYDLGAALLTAATNVLYGARISDEPTCYKMLRRALLLDLKIESHGFDFCPEVTAKLLLRRQTIHEMPISYNPRRRREGKKIKVVDAISALCTLLRWRIQRCELKNL